VTAAPQTHNRRSPDVGASCRTIPTAPALGLGGSSAGAFVVPFLPFEIEPLRVGPPDYAPNVVEDRKHEVQRIQAAGARSHE
jgi:hypothetical protein